MYTQAPDVCSYIMGCFPCPLLCLHNRQPGAGCRSVTLRVEVEGVCVVHRRGLPVLDDVGVPEKVTVQLGGISAVAASCCLMGSLV